MKARELIHKRLDQIENRLKTLSFMVNRGSNVREFITEIKNTEEIVGELKDMIEREPRTPNEINRY
tara:strand:- start:2469 stop:2666 length:198 start_codon:yes stop_codon:yes gene_type:complete